MMWYGYGLSNLASNFVGNLVPVYLLIFSVLVIVLATVLNSAKAAIPIAVIVTAASAAYLSLFVRSMSLFFINEAVMAAGFLLALFVVAKMFFKV